MMGSTVGGVPDSHILDVLNLMEPLKTQVKMLGTALGVRRLAVVWTGGPWLSVVPLKATRLTQVAMGRV